MPDTDDAAGPARPARRTLGPGPGRTPAPRRPGGGAHTDRPDGVPAEAGGAVPAPAAPAGWDGAGAGAPAEPADDRRAAPADAPPWAGDPPPVGDPPPAGDPIPAGDPSPAGDSAPAPTGEQQAAPAGDPDAVPAPRPAAERARSHGAGTAPAAEAAPGAATGTASPDDAAADDTTPGGGTADGAGSDGAAGGSGAQGGFQVRLENFEGPFDLLLNLIAKHKLDVTEVALSTVTDEFIAHIRARGPQWDLDLATDFLVVAATLLDLKAARLLPAAEVEDEEDLALLEARDLLFARLLQYRAYKEIAGIFAARWEEEGRRRPRTVGLEPHQAALLPEVVLAIGPENFARMAARAMEPKKKPAVYVDHIHMPRVSVQEEGTLVVERLRAAASGSVTFAELTADAPGTLTVVARFLALLELYRERAVEFEQAEPLAGLTVRWIGADGAEPEVTDEFDRPPGTAPGADDPPEPDSATDPAPPGTE